MLSEGNGLTNSRDRSIESSANALVITSVDRTPAAKIETALTDGKSVYLVGNIELEDTVIYEGSNNINIQGENCTLTIASGVTQFFNFKNSYGTPVSVSETSATTFDFSSGDGVSDATTRITATGHAFTAGQLLKIYSDDDLPAQHNSNEQKGEFFKVGAVSGNFIYSLRELVESYSTTVKCALPSSAKVHIEGIELSYNGGDTVSGITVEGYVAPYVKIKTYGIRGSGLTAIGNAFGQFVIQSDNHANASNVFGYGGNFSSDYYSTVVANGSYLRHLVTTNVESTTAGDSLIARRGRCIGSSFNDSTGFHCAGAFDTHPDGLDIRFNNCTAINAYRGYNSSGSGFQIRGPRAVLNNCRTINCNIGYDLKRSTGETLESRVVLNNCSSDYDDLPVNITGLSANSIVVDLNTCNVNNARGSDIIDTTYCTTRINQGIYEFATSATSNARTMSLAVNSTVTIRDAILDYSKSSQTNMRLANIDGTGCSLTAIVEFLEGGSNKLGSFIEGNSNNVTLDLFIKRTTTNTVGFSNLGSGSVAKLVENYSNEVPSLIPDTGRYIGTHSGLGTGTTTNTGAANRLEAYPWVPRFDITIDQIAINVTTGVGSATAKVAFYTSNVLGQPSTLIYESTDFDCGSTAVVTQAASLTFKRGQQYWIVSRHNSTAQLGAWAQAVTPDLDISTPGTTAGKVLRRTLTYATAAPASFGYTSSETTSNVNPTAIWLRKA